MFVFVYVHVCLLLGEGGDGGSGGGGNGSGNTTRPASWPPTDPHKNDSRDTDSMIARNFSEDRPVLLNVGGKVFEVGQHFLKGKIFKK